MRFFVSVLASGVFLGAFPASGQDGAPAAEQAFAEAAATCARDAGALWGLDLCGPILIVDPATRRIRANQAGASGALVQDGVSYAGLLPTEVNIANTALDWDGVRWAMLIAPLPEDAEARMALIMHERWHSVQTELGLPAASDAPAHLASEEGRVLMRLEWRALSAALSTDDDNARRRAVADALAFRVARRGEDQAERRLEMNEGLAEYTGVRLGRSNARATAIAALAHADGGDAFARSFAYASGPAYGLLLDGARPNWRMNLDAEADLGRLLAEALNIASAPDLADAETRYDGVAVRADEANRAAAMQVVQAGWRARLVDGPRLILPFSKMQIAFNPNGVTPLPSAGTVYTTLRVVDAWGVLEATDGALIDPNWRSAAVVAPVDVNARSGAGWTLSLNPGWRLDRDTRPGDYRVVKETPGE